MDKLSPEELKAINALADLCRADWERRPAIIEAFLKASTRRIVSTNGILAGKPCLEGTRLSVTFLRDLIQSVGIEDAIKEYPWLNQADLKQLVETKP